MKKNLVKIAAGTVTFVIFMFCILSVGYIAYEYLVGSIQPDLATYELSQLSPDSTAVQSMGIVRSVVAWAGAIVFIGWLALFVFGLFKIISRKDR